MERVEGSRQRLGREGEAAAAEALERLGWVILERRFRTRHGEIDLIAIEGDRVIFVEVKARSGCGFGFPAASVTPVKQRRIALTALRFLRDRGWLERPCRFDVVEVRGGTAGVESVRHIVDAFRIERYRVHGDRRRGCARRYD